jgi:iron-sulfur cluster insertion protein
MEVKTVRFCPGAPKGFSMEHPVEITDDAAAKIRGILAEEGNPLLKLRIFVQGGGCSGFTYGFTLDAEQAEDDFDIEHAGISLLIDAMSMQYLQGTKVDYKETLAGSNFVLNNPNATHKCGCGSSFGV